MTFPAKYIRDFVHSGYSKVKTLHQNIQQIDVNKLDELEEGQFINPYKALRTWFVEYVLVLGTLTTIPTITVMYITSRHVVREQWGELLMLLPLSFGCVWWLYEQLIQRYTEKRN